MTGYKTCKHNRTGQECDSWADVMDFMGVSGGLNTMAKAILGPEMPESCKQCKLGHYDELYDITHCDILRECMPYEGRHPDCPLKPVEKGG